MSSPAAAAVSGAAAATDDTDPDIEALNLRGAARKGAYALKKTHPSVTFTSGRRDKEDQARAMASNVVLNRNWIEETYASSKVSKACQKWVDDNPEKTTKEDIQEGLLSVLNDATDCAVGDVEQAPVGRRLRRPTGRHRCRRDQEDHPWRSKVWTEFLEKEGGLIRWHAQF